MTYKKPRNGKRRSLIWGFVDRLTAMIYSFFVRGRAGDMLSSHDTLCRNSYLSQAYERKRGHIFDALIKYPEMIITKSTISRMFSFLGGFFSNLGINVYGIFLVFYGLTSCIAHFVPAFINGVQSFNDVDVIIAGLIVFCSLPMLFSSQSVTEAISGSRLVRKLVLKILCVPECRLKAKKRYGGTIYMFVASIIAITAGIFSIYLGTLTVPLILLYFIVVFAMFAYPEIGVVTTFALLPFMQYFPRPGAVLLLLVILTGISYAVKIFQRKRTFSLSAEVDMVLLFCGFIIVGGTFSYGGLKTFLDSISAVVIIFGGFVITYNLINTRELLYSCLKTLTASFMLLCIVGVWEGGYYGLSERIIDSVSPEISSITDGNVLYILDNGAIFGMFAIIVFPLLFGYISKRKSAQGAVAVILLCILVSLAAWMCSYYEIIIALMIECVIFWFLFSHRTMTVVIFALIPIGIAAVLYPYAVSNFGWPNISEMIVEYMPASMWMSDTHVSVAKDVVKMLCDGNLIGIGAGNTSFGMIFPAYATDASLGAEDPMSFGLQIICWSGIFGFAAFVIFIAFLFKRSLGFFITFEKSELRSRALALFCGLVVSLLIGGVYSIWGDARVLYLFWASAGLLLGHIKLGYSDENARKSNFEEALDAADVEVIFYD